MRKEQIDAEVEEITNLGNDASGIEPDAIGLQSEEITGKFKKHYSFDYYDEVYVEVFENGAILYKAGTGIYEWYNKNHVKKCFEKARILGERSKRLNRMLG